LVLHIKDHEGVMLNTMDTYKKRYRIERESRVERKSKE
jgi:hypothetical protein